jgi:hypothetical protein
LVTPVITINHVDRVDNMNVKITTHPEDQLNSNTLSASFHPPLVPNLPRRRSPSVPLRSAPAFHLASLKPLWGSEKPKIHRSASSPQLTDIIKEKRNPKELRQEKVQPAPFVKNKLRKERRSNSTSCKCVNSICKSF